MEEIEKRRENEIKARLQRETVIKSLSGINPSQLGGKFELNSFVVSNDGS